MQRTRSTRLDSCSSIKASTAVAASHTPSTLPSPLSVFLRNVRLLQLDSLEDWPSLSLDTFATTGKDAQGQKRRIQAVEWVLFRLFELWDAQLAADKLKPYFPPLDQVQSVNLRAALSRCLEHVKKVGALGRDAIVRKSMLDDCQGPRLEQILASFSSAVLKKVVFEEDVKRGQHVSPVMSMAVEEMGYRDDKSHLQILGYVHESSLHKSLNRRQTKRERYADFADLLQVSERKLHRRKEALQSAAETENLSEAMTSEYKARVQRTVRHNWTGNEQWMSILLHGTEGATEKGLTSMPFDKLWRRVEQGRLDEVEASSMTLLDQLDTRVRVQKERIQKWEAFRRRMFGDDPPMSPLKKMKTLKEHKQQRTQERGIDVDFTAHQHLQLGNLQRVAVLTKPSLNEEYSNLMQGFSDTLNTSQPVTASLDFLHDYHPVSDHRQSLSSKASGDEVISELSELDTEEDEEVAPPTQSFQTRMDSARRLPVRPKLSPSKNDSPSPFHRLSRKPTFHEAEEEDGSVEEDVTLKGPLDLDMSQATSTQSLVETYEKDIMPPPSPTQKMADEILESMNNASPSPMKTLKKRPTLSLADRTRLSMARGSAFFDADDEPDDTIVSHPPDLTMDSHTAKADESSIVTQDTAKSDDLASRTRKSMVGFEKAVQKAKMERRRSQRQSRALPQMSKKDAYFSKVQEEDEEVDREALTEELMAEEDMEAVFRSRPKIAASPIPSPTRDWDDQWR